MRWSRTWTLVETHAAGSVAKVLTSGVPDVPGACIREKMDWLRDHDGLRRVLLHEPRGAPGTSVNVLLPACDPRADLGFVIMEGAEYVLMSGSNTIGTATVILETGIVPMREPVTRLVLEAPGGLVEIRCRCRAGKVVEVEFANLPAFVVTLDRAVEVPGHGTVQVDVAWGGMFYALVDARALGFRLAREEARDICIVGEAVRAACREQVRVVHPEDSRVAGVQSVQFTLPARRRRGRLGARNTVVVHPGHLDRSPCGTGTSARLAVMHARGQARCGDTFDHEGILGTRFRARLTGETRVAGRTAIESTIAGQAWITGISHYGLDPSDPYPEGYTLADTWLQAV